MVNSSVAIASNDNWGTPVGDGADAAALSADFTPAGAFPFATGSLDSALAGTFATGNYTVLVSGNNNSTGIALVEVYDITPSAPDIVTHRGDAGERGHERARIPGPSP